MGKLYVRHRTKHNTPEKFVCTKCGEECSDKLEFKNHYQENHARKINNNDNSQS